MKNRNMALLFAMVLVCIACDDRIPDESGVDLTGTVTFSSPSPRVDEQITATYNPGNGTGGEKWQWYRITPPGDIFLDVIADTYTPVADDIGYLLKAVVSYADQDGDVSAVTADVVIASGDDDSMAYVYVATFQNDHYDALMLTLATVLPRNEAIVDAALAAYALLDETTQSLLSAEKALLDSLKTKINEQLADDIFYSVSEVAAYLAQAPSTTESAPLSLAVRIDLRDMTQPDSDWYELLAAVDSAGTYVSLDLSQADMVWPAFFDPDNSVSTGKQFIVNLVLPEAATYLFGSSGGGSSDDSAFYGFTALVSVSGAGITSIDYDVFNGCTTLKSVSFPMVHTIGIRAFSGCTSLESVNFPKASNISNNVFSDCISLKSVHFPAVTSIFEGAFQGCVSLESVSFPVLEDIGWAVFSDCISLKSVSFPVAKYIRWSAFSGCTSLESVESVSFSAVREIGNRAFMDCISLTSVSFPGVTSIGSSAFYNCASLESISFPAATSIENGAFRGCISLERVSFPAATNLEYGVFEGCSSLTDADFPAAVTIGGYAVGGCTSLGNLNIPAVEYIDNHAFCYTGTVELMITMGREPPLLGVGIFVGVDSPKTVFVKVGTAGGNYIDWFYGLVGMGWDGEAFVSENDSDLNGNIQYVRYNY